MKPTEKEKAYIGDGLLRAIIGIIYSPLRLTNNEMNWLQSNATLNGVWFLMQNGYVGGKISGKRYADRYEASIYDVYKKDGFEAAIDYVRETHTPYIKRMSAKIHNILENETNH